MTDELHKEVIDCTKALIDALKRAKTRYSYEVDSELTLAHVHKFGEFPPPSPHVTTVRIVFDIPPRLVDDSID